MKIKPINLLTPSKENGNSVLDRTIPRTSGIYFLYDENLELIYIGKAKYLRARLVQHTSNGKDSTSSNLPKEIRNIIKFYSFIEILDENERNIRELILIDILKPIFNNGNIENKAEEYFKKT